ncbi:MAG TPA: DUF3750 domain-containing protein [Burkholderiales bacterium]|jgi:hypothetical protein
MKVLAKIAYVLLAFLAGATAVMAQDWRTASREPTGAAPDPKVVREAVVQVYGARTVGVKGFFGVHTWVAVKPTDAPEWTVYEVIGWRLRYQDTAVVVRNRAPDGRWFGSEPELYADKRGAGVDELIKRIDAAAKRYPYAGEYGLWPGPNSNTFTAWIARAVPELEVDLPPTAIGKDYLRGSVVAKAPSGSGYQLSLRGLLGVAASSVEGVELNLLGLSFGVGPHGLKLPLVGTLGPARSFAAPAAAAAQP